MLALSTEKILEFSFPNGEDIDLSLNSDHIYVTAISYVLGSLVVMTLARAEARNFFRIISLI